MGAAHFREAHVTVTAVGQVEYRTLRLDGLYEIQNVEGLADLPDIRSSDATFLSRHGMHPGVDLLGGRRITITVTVHASTSGSFDAAVDALKEAFIPQAADLPLTFRFHGIAGGANAFINCRPRRLSMPVTSLWQQGFSSTAVIELFAADPVIYNEGLNSQSVTINAGSMNCVNGGNWPTLQRIEIAASSTPLTNPNVQNNHLSVLKHLTLSKSYNSGDQVTFLPALRKIVYDPTGAPPAVDGYSALSGDSLWWELQPGSNTIVTSRTAGTGTATVYWYHAWL